MKNFKNTTTLDASTREEVQSLRQKHALILAQLSKNTSNPNEGYFGPESMTWKVYREPSIVLGSMRALLMQVAHPAIAQGVASFSNFEKDYAGRAHRTFLSMVRIWFGDINTANQSARRLHHIHSLIRGQMVWETEDEFISKPFCAADPDLLYWVLATLIDTSILLFEKTIRPLSVKEKNQFYEESKITAQLMGIALEEYPENLEMFYAQYHRIIEDGTLQLKTEGQQILQALSTTPYPIRRLNEILATGLFPTALRNMYKLKSATFLFRLIINTTKIINRLVPNDLRYAPHYHQAKFRLALSDHTKPRWIERLHYWLSSHINWYFISNKLIINRT